jgi:hypothetical protein
MLKIEAGKIKEILREKNNLQELLVELKNKRILKALNYTNLNGVFKKGEEILLNITAQELNLGTGEYCFVVGSISKNIELKRKYGHIIKLRYTPYQFSIKSVEEVRKYRKKIENFKNLERIPVVVGTLHSQIAPISVILKKLSNNKVKISYLMTDSASLPLSLSNLVHLLKERKFIDYTITCGQAFGGDYETVNLYTGLIFAKEVLNSNIIIVSPGPGTVGTRTKYGFSSIEQGEIINSVSVLGGVPVAVLRISFADKRERHRGISNHNIVSLSEISLRKAIVCVPKLEGKKMKKVISQIGENKIDKKHILKIVDAEKELEIFEKENLKVETMGRSIKEDREFFLSAIAAGIVAFRIFKNGENF